MSELLEIYRERGGDPGFWAEPFNALTNIAFLVAAGLAWRLAVRRQAMTPATTMLIVLAATVGVGSFVFHTAAGPVTMWLDVIPIAAFQMVYLWLAYSGILGLSGLLSSMIVIVVMVASFAMMPVKEPLNGSLFYIPAWIALGGLGTAMAAGKRFREPWLLLMAAGCFTLSIAARSLDFSVPWRIGSHFLWHTLNGVVVYLGLRSWILDGVGRNPGTGLSSREGSVGDENRNRAVVEPGKYLLPVLILLPVLLFLAGVSTLVYLLYQAMQVTELQNSLGLREWQEPSLPDSGVFLRKEVTAV